MFNPLLTLHQQANAELISYGQTPIVNTYGQGEAEYAAVRKAAALFDCPQRGVLELTGKDRLPFLNNLLTNQTWDKQTRTGLVAGQGAYAFFLNLKGRIVADMNVLELGERTLLDMDVRMLDPVRVALEKYLFSEQVNIASRVGLLHQLALHGPGAVDVLRQVCSESNMDISQLSCRSTTMFDASVVVWRDDSTGTPGYNLILDASIAANVWSRLIDRFAASEQLGRRALRPAGWAVFNACRIESGRALFGIDFDESVLPAETGLLSRAVSFTKGCYLGQEIVARMHARGQLARQFAGIRMDDDALPIAGAKIFDDESNEIGGITSSTVSPVLSNAAICLGYLKRPHFNVGTIVNIPAEGSMRKGSVVALPFMSATT